MTKLTVEQERFLNRHSISISAVLDASGMARSTYSVVAKRLGKDYVIGVTPCGRAGHTMRTRKGACLQCNTAHIAFGRRFSSNGFVYIVGSLKNEVIKVGLTNDPSNRADTLNRDEYGGGYDWKLLYYAKVPSAGRVEFDAQKHLRDYAAPLTYISHGVETHCLETFRCNYLRAISAIRDVSGDIYEEEETGSKKYEFKELVGDGFTRKGNKSIRSLSSYERDMAALDKEIGLTPIPQIDP